MPERAKRPCNQPGCPQLTNERYCLQHQQNNVQAQAKRQYDRNRKDDPYRRLYDTAQWKRTRKAMLARDPICRWPDCIMPSEVVDHITPIRQGGDQFDANNLQGLCKRHHDIKTATEDGGLGHKRE